MIKKKRVEKETLNRTFFSAPKKRREGFLCVKVDRRATAPKRHAHRHTQRESSRALVVVFGQHERLFFESSTFFTREKQLFKRVFG